MADIEHNFDEFQQIVAKAPEEYKKRVQNPLGEFIGQKFGEFATTRYMQQGPSSFGVYPPPRPPNLSGPIRILEGRLAQAVRGGQGENFTLSHTDTNTDPLRGIFWKREIFVMYAAIHEKGGTVKVPTTQGVVAHFWKRWYDTGKDKYKYIALAAQKRSHFVIQIPKRPYIQPTLQDIRPFVIDEGQRLLDEFVEDMFG